MKKNKIAFVENRGRGLLTPKEHKMLVNVDSGEEIWSLSLNEKDNWIFSKNESVYYMGILDIVLTKVNAWTGIPDWELKRDRKGLFFGRYAFTDKYIFIDGDEWSEPTQYYLYRINPETLEIMKVDFKNFNTFFIDGDRLYVISEEGKVLTEIDPETCVPSKIFKIDEYIKGGVLELVEDPNVAFLSVTSKNGNFIFNLKEPKNPIPIQGPTNNYLYTKTGNKMMNHHGLLVTKEKMYGINFKTGEQYWWIDKADLGLEKGESYDVLECDWRGVLVATRDEVIAFGPP